MMSFKVDKSKLPLHKREELKRKEDEKLAEEVYKEFVATFEDSPSSKLGKTFVRGEVVNPDETSTHGPRPRLYKPSPTLFKPPSHHEPPVNAARRAAEEKARKIMEEAMRSRPNKLGQGNKKKEENKRVSNLEAFKEELRRAQEERAERRKLRQQLQEHLGMEKEPLDRIAPSLDNPYLGTYDTDPTTTNLFLSNLNPKMSEEDLCRIFGHYGPLASVKIMWPRSDDERARGYHTGFIAFMTRRDAERAVAALKGKLIMNFEMKLSWGKSVPIPAHPIYIPPKMLELTLPPPPSGLPFNAQYRKEDRDAFKSPTLPPPGAPPPTDPEQREAWEKMIRNALVKVVIPTERPLLCAIHRMVEFVVREGPMFEAMIMNREMNNPLYRFLFDNQSPAHVYYRWKLFSVLEGDSPSKWKTGEFRMFENGSIWRPPVMNFYHQGLPLELYDEDELSGKQYDDDEEDEDEKYDDEKYYEKSSRQNSSDNNSSSQQPADSKHLMPPPPSLPPHPLMQTGKRGQLTEKQRVKVEEMLKNLTPEREKVAEAMIYCVEHAEAAEEIVDLICESIWSIDSTIPRKIAKLYLISDILANCTAKVSNVSHFRKHISNRLEEIFSHIHCVYDKIDARLKAEQFKQRIMLCFRSWEDTVIYATDFLIRLQNIFLGLTGEPEKPAPKTEVELSPNVPVKKSKWETNTDDELDGVPLSAAEKKVTVTKNTPKRLVDYDLDGVPLEEEEDSGASSNKKQRKVQRVEETNLDKPMFVKSKWEEVDPDLFEQQAVTSSKWEKNKSEKIFFDEDIDGIPMDEAGGSAGQSFNFSSSNTNVESMSEDKRRQLREIEVKVMKFQDELESGAKKRSSGISIQEEVCRFREKLMQKVRETNSKPSDEKHSSHSSHKKDDGKDNKDKQKLHRHESSSNRKKDKESPKTSSSGSKSDKVDKNSKGKKRSRTPSSKKSKRSKKSPSRSSSPASSSKHKKKKH